MNPTPTNPQPAKMPTPITNAHTFPSTWNPQKPWVYAEECAALERTLAEREAEVAEQKRWLVAASKDLEESREKRHAAEERAQRVEHDLEIACTQREKDIKENADLSARLATVADEIEKSGAVEAFGEAIRLTQREWQPNAWVRAHSALTALVAKLREGKL